MKHRLTFTALAILAALALLSDAAAQTAASWSVLNITGAKPAPRKEHTMVYDPIQHQVILYGGYDTVARNDLWVLHLDGNPYWEQITPPGNPGVVPPPLFGHCATWDPQNNRMLLLGGRIDTGTSFSSFPDGVRALKWSGTVYEWKLQFNYSTNLINACQATPTFCRRAFSRRTNSAAVALPNRLFMMGGNAASPLSTMNDTWADAFGEDNWYRIAGSMWGGFQPCDSCIDFQSFPLRSHHTMIADPSVPFGRRIIFGGVEGGEQLLSVFYSVGDGPLTGPNWTFFGNVPTSPHNFSRYSHTAVYDPLNLRMVVVGGYVPSPGLPPSMTSAVTSLPLPEVLPTFTPPQVNNSWILHSPTGDPGPMAEHAAVFDPQNNRVVVFGGVSTTNALLRNNDVWVLTFPTPPAVTLGGQAGKQSSKITWTAPNGAGSYDLRRSTSPITEQNFDLATKLPTDPPSSAGTLECATSAPLTPCVTYWYALKWVDVEGNESFMSNVLSHHRCSGASYMCTGGGGNPVAMTPSFPPQLDFAIRGANPAFGSTTLHVGVPASRHGESMVMEVYDIAGRRVRTLWSTSATKGEHEVTWDHRDERGARVARGVYFARLKVGNETRAQKIVVQGGF